MSLAMTVEEREAFLADVHIGVLAVARPDGGTFAVPVWYAYRPGEITVMTAPESMKTRLIRQAGRFSMTVHSEQVPYRYVTAEGPVVAFDTTPRAADMHAIASRYVSSQEAERLSAPTDEDLVIRMKPERWLSEDLSKAQ